MDVGKLHGFVYLGATRPRRMLPVWGDHNRLRCDFVRKMDEGPSQMVQSDRTNGQGIARRGVSRGLDGSGSARVAPPEATPRLGRRGTPRGPPAPAQTLAFYRRGVPVKRQTSPNERPRPGGGT